MLVRHLLTILLGLGLVVVICSCGGSDSDGFNPLDPSSWGENPYSNDNGDTGNTGGSDDDSDNDIRTVKITFFNRSSCDQIVEVELSGSILAKRTLGPGQMYIFSQNCQGDVIYYYRNYPVSGSDCSGSGQGGISCGGSSTRNIM